MVRTQVQLTEKQVRELKAMAAKRNVSIAALIRLSVDNMLASSRLADHAEIRRRTIAAAGCCHSGVGDLSERHDDYFVESVVDPVSE